MFLLVAGVFGVIIPDWIICACGLGSFEDEKWLQWGVRVVGLGMAGLSLYLMYRRR